MSSNNLAYIDSIRCGLVPCKPIQLSRYGIKARITATRGTYKKGDIVEYTYNMIVPRKAVRYYGGNARIMRYTWYTDENNQIQFVIG